MTVSINVTSTLASPAPFTGIWETQLIGFVSTDTNLTGAIGIVSSNTIFGNVIESVGLAGPSGFTSGTGNFLLLMAAGTSPASS